MSKSVLFVCNLNAVRSVLAEYMTNGWYEGVISASSCGVIAGSPDGYAASVALEDGIDITAHESRYLSDIDCSQFDEIISFSEDADHEVRRLTLPSSVKTDFWQVRDLAGLSGPRDERLILYRGVYEDIKNHLITHFGPKIG